VAFVLVTVGLLMVITGFKGTYAAFGSQVASDFTGSQPFTWWVLAIGGIGAVGYIDSLRTFSRLFMALILIVMILANGGFFAKLTAAIKQGPVAPPAGTGSLSTNSASSSSTGGSNVTSSGASTSGLFGQAPDSAGQGKFNQYMNTFLHLFTGG
jgi:hypothetical protein